MFEKRVEKKGVHRSNWLVTTTNRGQNDELQNTIPMGNRIGSPFARDQQLANGELGIIQLWDCTGRELPAGISGAASKLWGASGEYSTTVATVSG